jgi:hypothetical protein
MKRRCPQCGTDVVRRIEREGNLERLLNALGVRPFRCQICTHGFRAFSPGIRSGPVDRRQYLRLSTHVRATIIDKPSRGDEVVTDLSMGGCRLKIQTPLSPGTLFHLQLRPSEPEQVITLQAVLVRFADADSMGLEFLALEPRQKRQLIEFVQHLLMSQTPRRYTPRFSPARPSPSNQNPFASAVQQNRPLAFRDSHLHEHVIDEARPAQTDGPQ